MRNILFLGVLFPLCCALFAPAFGQAELRASVTGYPSVYFAGSNPASALEMVQLLPGFRLQTGDATVRGYSGSLGNVLIDGLPPASKEDSLETILQRIPAASVLQIELIRPGAAGIDMHGFAMLANVVRRPNNAPRGQVQSDIFYFPHYGMYVPKETGQISFGSTQVLDLSGSISQSVDESRGGIGTRSRYNLSGAPIYLSNIWQKRHEDDWTVSGAYRQPLFGGNVNVSALYKSTRFFDDPREYVSLPPNGFSPATNRDFTSASEFSAQYRHGLWSGGEAELVGVRRGANEYASQTVTTGGGSATLAATYTSETILRGALRHHADALSLEAGVESAINTLGNNLTFISGGAPLALPGADVRISEWRTEFFGTATWQALSNLTVETGLRYEMTHLKQQSSSAAPTKDFFYLKPRILVSWKPTSNDELRLSYERIAGQLDFINFIPTINLNSNTITAGNVNLVPDTKWRTEGTWEHRLAGGSLILTGRHEAIKNVVDRIPVFASSGAAFDGVGNIGSGHRDEVQVDFLRPLDDIGLTGVTLQGSFTRRTSRVIDPTTGKARPISLDYPIENKISLTQDLPDLKLRWGATFNHAKLRITNRFNEERFDYYPETFDVFVEFKPQPQWLLRLSGHNILDRPIYHSRDLYSGPRNTASFNFREIRPALVGASIGLTIQRTF